MSTPDFSALEIETGRKLFAGACDFVAGAETLDRIPPISLPEVAFVGRSNVGKSSLVNALTGRKALARVSHTPGRTQQLNFFDLGGKLLLVDMPGYGFAKVSKTQSAAWNDLIRTYLRGRATLRCVFVLVDSRRGMKDVDHDVLKLLDEAGVACRIVLTKCDEIKAAELERGMQATAAALVKHPSAFPKAFPTSAQEGTGLEELRALIAQMG